MSGNSFRLDIPPLGFRPVIFMIFGFGILFGGAGAGIGYVVLWGDIKDRPPVAFFFILPLPFMLFGLLALCVAFKQMLVGYIFEADSAGLTVTSCLGYFCRRRRFETPALRDLVVRNHLAVHIQGTSQDHLQQADILACLDSGPRKLLLRRYGADEVRRLCEALRQAIWPEQSADDPDAPPRGGYLTWSKTSQGPHIHMRAEPMRQVGANSTWVSIFLMIFSTFFLAGFVAIVWQTEKQLVARILLTSFCVFLWLVFQCLGFYFLIKTRRHARQSADILVTHDQIQIDTGPVAPQHFVWKVGEIQSIRVAPSGIAVNDQPIFELLITPMTGASVKLFTGRDTGDLHWLATTLSHELRVATPEDRRVAVVQALAENPVPELLVRIDAALVSGRIRRIPDPQALIFEIPPAGLRRVIPLAIFAGLWNSFIAVFLFLMLRAPNATVGAFLFMIPFVAIGIFLIFLIRRMSLATARTEISGNTLLIRWQMLRRGESKIDCPKIVDLRCDHHSDSDGRGQDYLKISLTDGAQSSFLSGFAGTEIQALATALRLALGLAD